MPPLANQFVDFIIERENIRKAKEAGLPRPWTNDPILAHFRFCNIHREDDKVTKQIREWAMHFRGDQDIWFAFVVARLFNNKPTLEEVYKWTLPFKGDRFGNILRIRQLAGHKNFNAAYIVSTNGVSMNKVDYVVQRILVPLWADRAKVRPTVNDDLLGWHARLAGYNGLGSFIAAQVVADAKYVLPLSKARDWWTFAASGPGSRRGLNRVMGRPVDAPWTEMKWFAALLELAAEVKTPLAKAAIELHNQDLQNCLCEYSKYAKVQDGTGVPKQLYRPGDG